VKQKTENKTKTDPSVKEERTQQIRAVQTFSGENCDEIGAAGAAKHAAVRLFSAAFETILRFNKTCAPKSIEKDHQTQKIQMHVFLLSSWLQNLKLPERHFLHTIFVSRSGRKVSFTFFNAHKRAEP
jgi:hypothetical protein